MRNLSLSMLVAIALGAVACGSSSSGGNDQGATPAPGAGGSGETGGTTGGGGSSAGGTATGGSATGGSATGGSATGGSATGGSTTGGSGGAAPGDPTILSTGLNDPKGLAVDASDIFLIQYMSGGKPGGGVFKVPLAGGTPTMLAPDDDGDSLAIDDAGVYWVDMKTDPPTIMRVGKDGSGATMLLQVGLNGGIAVVGGDVYYGFNPDPTMGQTDGGVAKVSATGGAPKTVLPVSLTGNMGNTTVLAADANGIVYSVMDITNGSTSVWHAALDGSGAAKLVDESLGASVWDFQISGGSLYWTQTDSSAKTTAFHSFMLPAGSDTTVATIGDSNDEFFATDANGTYLGNQMGDSQGVYKLDAGGMATKIYDDSSASMGVNGGDPRFLTLDATHLYWVGGGHNPGQAVLHSIAR